MSTAKTATPARALAPHEAYAALSPAARRFYDRHPKLHGATLRARVYFRPVAGADATPPAVAIVRPGGAAERTGRRVGTFNAYRKLGARLGVFHPSEPRAARRAKAHEAARAAMRGAPGGAVKLGPAAPASAPAAPAAEAPKRAARVNIEAARKGGKTRAATAVRGPGGRFVPRATPVAPGALAQAPRGRHFAP